MNWCDFFNAIPFSLGPERTKDAKTRFSPIQVSESVFKKMLYIGIQICLLFGFNVFLLKFIYLGIRSSGKTTLSASGLLLPDTLYDADLANRILEGKSQGLGLVVTVASVIEPFLSSKHRESISQV